MMKRSPAVAVLLGLVMVASLAQAASTFGSSRERLTATPGFVTPQVCPPATPSGFSNVTTSNVVTAGGEDARVRALARSSKTLLRSLKTARSIRVQTPVSITGRDQNAVLSSSRIPIWIANAVCQAPTIDSWFIGGSAAIESQSKLTLTNPAASNATVEVTTWTENGPATPISLVVSSRTSEVVSLDRFALGSTAVAVRVRALSGRVAASVFDVRTRGLTPLGADFVPAGAAPHQRQVVLGIVGGTPAARLRLLAPGNQDAQVRVDLVTSKDRFTPNGLDEIQLSAGRVVDVNVPLKAVVGLGALVIEANVDVVVGVYQPAAKNVRDFAWLASSSPLSTSTLALASQFPTSMLLFSPARSTSLLLTDIRGRAVPPVGVSESSVTIVDLKSPRWLESNDQVFAAAFSRNGFGITVVPLNPLSRSRSRVTPLPALSVVSPR